jgi:predicted amidohydrolase YtcJ
MDLLGRPVDRRTFLILSALAAPAALAACRSAVPELSGGPLQSAASSSRPIEPPADWIFTGGRIVTVEPPSTAGGIAIRGDRIVAVGSAEEMAAYVGPTTRTVALGTRALVPGFIDSHQHRIGDRGAQIHESAEALIGAAIEQGWTTIGELYADDGLLSLLRDLDAAGRLRLSVNAYLPINENSAEGKSLGAWYTAYQPGQAITSNVRAAGLKVFTDFNNATILLWKQKDLGEALLRAHRQGWQLAVKTVSTRSLAMIVKAFQAIQAADPGITTARGRLEHELFATADQIASIKQLGLVPIINANNPGQLVGEPDVDALIAREPRGSYTPWRDLFAAGIPAAGCTGFPSYYVDEPTGAPFGSPMHLIYQAVTRVGNLGRKPYPWLLDQAITAEQALRAYTFNGARASFEEQEKGSLTTGKRADLVVLSTNPLSVRAEQINDIEVLATMIAGKMEFVRDTTGDLAPSPTLASPGPVVIGSPTPEGSAPPVVTGNLAAGAAARASASLASAGPKKEIDGSMDSAWNAGHHPPQWIEIDLGGPATIEAIRLVVAQDPAGATHHRIIGSAPSSKATILKEIAGTTKDGDVLAVTPATPWTGLRIIRIETVKSPSWVAWREIEIIGRRP